MARTRSTKSGPSANQKASTATTSSATRYELPANSENPLKLFILPKKVTEDARVVTLPNPRSSKPSRYLVCPQAGFFEFTRISAPKTTPRSWLIEGSDGEVKAPGNGEGVEDDAGFHAKISRGAELFVASPIDPLFLLLPALAKQSSSKSSFAQKRMFLSGHDHLDAVSEHGGHLSEILRWEGIRKTLETRMAAACDVMEAGDESMFRLSEKKLVEEVLSKARRMGVHGLPSSMEEKFVTKTLEAPIMGIRSAANPTAHATENRSAPKGEDADTSEQAKAPESQSSVSSLGTSTSSLSDASTAATSISDEPAGAEVVSAMKASDEVVKLQRLRVAVNFICSSYIAPETAESLKTQLSSAKTSVDFKPLDEYLAELARVKQEAAATRSSDFSRKRNRDEEDDERAEKKRKKDEEEKRKKSTESRGVKELKKVNTKGMMKLSHFFNKV